MGSMFRRWMVLAALLATVALGAAHRANAASVGGDPVAPATAQQAVPTVVPSPTPLYKATLPAQYQVALKLEPAALSVAKGQEFEVQVVASSDIPLRGAQFGLKYDPSAIEVLAVNEGDFFSAWAQANGASTMVFPQPEVDAQAGQVSDMGVAIMGGPVDGPKGQGVVCTYRLVAKKATDKPLKLTNAAAANHVAQTLPNVTTSDAAVTVAGGAGLPLTAILLAAGAVVVIGVVALLLRKPRS